MNSKEPKICGKFVSWWDGEYERECELPEGHKGPHYDGVSCFTDDGEEVELKSLPPKPLYLNIQYFKNGQVSDIQNQVLDNQNRLITFQPEPDIQIVIEVKQ